MGAMPPPNFKLGSSGLPAAANAFFGAADNGPHLQLCMGGVGDLHHLGGGAGLLMGAPCGVSHAEQLGMFGGPAASASSQFLLLDDEDEEDMMATLAMEMNPSKHGHAIAHPPAVAQMLKEAAALDAAASAAASAAAAAAHHQPHDATATPAYAILSSASDDGEEGCLRGGGRPANGLRTRPFDRCQSSRRASGADAGNGLSSPTLVTIRRSTANGATPSTNALAPGAMQAGANMEDPPPPSASLTVQRYMYCLTLVDETTGLPLRPATEEEAMGLQSLMCLPRQVDESVEVTLPPLGGPSSAAGCAAPSRNSSRNSSRRPSRQNLPEVEGEEVLLPLQEGDGGGGQGAGDGAPPTEDGDEEVAAGSGDKSARAGGGGAGGLSSQKRGGPCDYCGATGEGAP